MSKLTLRGDALKVAAARLGMPAPKNRKTIRSHRKRHVVAGALRSMHCGPGLLKTVPRQSRHRITLRCSR